MRERLVAALVGTVVVVVALMAVVRAYAIAGEITQKEELALDQSLAMAAVAIDERVQGDRPITPAFLTRLSDEEVAIDYRPAGGTTVAGGAPVADSDRTYAATRRLPDGAVLTVVRPSGDVADRVSAALLPLALLALGLMAGAAVVGWLLARRLARPFQELASAARGLARGRRDVVVPHYRVAEAEAIGTALREGLARLDGLLDREREFALSASHELRTPITALRLQVDDLGRRDGLPEDARDDVAGVLRGLDRLATAVLDVLGVARLQRATQAPIDVGAVVSGAVEQATSRRSRRRVEVRLADGVLLDLPADPLADAVSALVDDCLRAGSGRVRVELDDRRSHAEVVVADEGPRRGTPDVVQVGPGGAGLAAVVAEAESFGARLLVADEPTHRYRLLLPGASRVLAGAGPESGSSAH